MIPPADQFASRWIIPCLLALMFGAARPVQATECPTPDPFVIADTSLPATIAAARRGSMTVVTLGGAATLGGPAKGSEFTYPARLEVRLRAGLPSVTVKVVVRAIARQSTANLLARLGSDLAADKPSLVIWGPGGSAAGRGDDLETFNSDIASIIAEIRASGADLILMTLQYAPSLARVINLFPYRTALIRSAEMADVPVFDRYELMRYWSDNNFLDLDVTDPADRVRVARKVYDCMADILARGIVDAVK